MAQPTLTATGVEHADGSTLTGWDSPSELGSVIMAWGITTDFFIEGADALGMEQKTGTGVKGIRFNLASTTDFSVTNRKLQVLFWVTSVAIIDTLAAGGIRIYAHDGTDYAFWYVGGNDVSWVGNGWKLITIDLNTTPDFDNATFDPTTVDYVGVAANFTGVLGRADGIAVDLVRHIDLLEAKGGSLLANAASATSFDFDNTTDDITRNTGSWTTDGFEVNDIVEVRNAEDAANNGRYLVTAVSATVLTFESGDITTTNTVDTAADVEAEFTLQDIINEDQINNSNWYGTVVKGDTGSFEINGNLVIGDVSGADYTSFRSSNETIVFPDNNLSAGMNEISVAEDTGETRVKFGSSVGSGDSEVGFGGSVFYAASEVYTVTYGLDLSTSITECLIFGSVFNNAEDGILLSASGTDNKWINNTVSNSGEVNSDDAVVRNSFFNSTSSPSTASAFLWVTNTDIKNSFFNGNTGTDISAIRHTDGTSRTYFDLLFAGNTNDVFLNHASADLTINKDGTANPTTSRSSGSGSVTFVGSVNIKITVKDTDGNAVVGARVFMEAGSTGSAPFQDSVTIVSTGTTATATHTTHGLVDGQFIVIRGANEQAYNGFFTITNSTANDYDYTMLSDPVDTATGTIIATQGFMNEDTIGGGVAEESFNAGATQSYTGRVREATTSPLFKLATFSGTDISGGIDLPVQVIGDES